MRAKYIYENYNIDVRSTKHSNQIKIPHVTGFSKSVIYKKRNAHFTLHNKFERRKLCFLQTSLNNVTLNKAYNIRKELK